MNKHASHGKCHLCSGTFNKAGMTRHLKSCLIDKGGKSPSAKKSRGGETKLFHIAIEGRYQPVYWMHVEVSANAKLCDLDDFLRHIWLECCGHMSAFTIDGIRYSVSPMAEFRERGMGLRIGEVLRSKMKFFHEYDFGTATELALKVVSERMEQGRAGKLRILARNDPPVIECDFCGNPATQICVECIYDNQGQLCEDCAQKHGCDEDMFLPVVNSPRVGTCGYTGEVD